MGPFGPKIPTTWCSNLVFASDGTRVFGVDAGGTLGSVIVPREPTAGPGPLRREPTALGAVIAVGWLEGRLATIALREGHLELSHGEYGVNLAPSRAARVPLSEAGVRLEAGARLEPYARWWQEVNPQEELFGGISLVRDADGALHAVAVWREGGTTKWTMSLVAERVAAIAPRDDERTTLFVGEVASPAPRAAKQRGIFLLSRRFGGGPEIVEPFVTPSSNHAFVGSAERNGGALVTTEITPGAWSFFRVDAAGGCDRLPGVVRVTRGEVLGAHADASGAPALVVCDETKRTLSLARVSGTAVLASSTGAIAQAAVSPVAPIVAYLTNEGDLTFAWSGDA